jgi:hypothetical protein
MGFPPARLRYGRAGRCVREISPRFGVLNGKYENRSRKSHEITWVLSEAD